MWPNLAKSLSPQLHHKIGKRNPAWALQSLDSLLLMGLAYGSGFGICLIWKNMEEFPTSASHSVIKRQLQLCHVALAFQ
jgi:hypothetical protein